jgi:hypothetical protein
LQDIRDILNGYSLPEPYFSQHVKELVETLFTALDDPHLPLLEMEVGVGGFQSR